MSTAAKLATGRALILTGDVAHLDGQTVPTPPAADVVHLLSITSWAFGGDPGVLLLDTHNAATYGFPLDETFDVLREAGWTGTYREGWAKLRHPDHPTVHLGLLADLDPFRCPLLEYLPADDDAPGEPVLDIPATAAAFMRWQAVTGRPWFGTPGAAGWDVLAPMLRDGSTRVAFKPDKQPGVGRAGEAAYHPRQWSAPGGTDAAQLPYAYAHGYDASRMYLAALINAEVSPWALRPTGPIPFDKKLAGWWLIDVPAWNDPTLPDPAGYATGSRRRWVTTPTAHLLDELADRGLSAGFDVLDSYTGAGRRLFRPFGELMEAGYLGAVASGQAPVAAAFKQAGAREVIGLMNSGGGTFFTHRPDWHHTIIARARVNLWRKMFRVAEIAGRFPQSVDTDCVWYGSDNPDPIAAAPPTLVLGDRLGQFKIKGSR